MKYDITIIGAGIVGLATAYKLLKNNPQLKIAVVEKESGVAKHQTGHNSGVIHSGIYYRPGSLKALNCQSGYKQLIEFSKEYGIKYDLCGKVIVATSKKEIPALKKIYDTGLKNGLKGIKKLSASEVKEIEPYVAAVEGLFVPQTGIIDYTDVAEKYAELIEGMGGDIFFNEKVVDIIADNGTNRVVSSKKEINADVVINCSGLYADKVAEMTMDDIDAKVIPFRGEYYELKKEKQYLVNNLIYPVPNPDFPFLGVHYTRMIHGGIEAGPNAVFAFKREGYSRWDFNFKEFFESVTYSGMRKVAAKYWKVEMGELYRSFSKRAFVKALQHLIPEVSYDDLKRGGAGVRAQTIDRSGNLVDDFDIIISGKVVNVLNAPSPAATASLAIGGTIAEKALSILN